MRRFYGFLTLIVSIILVVFCNVQSCISSINSNVEYSGGYEVLYKIAAWIDNKPKWSRIFHEGEDATFGVGIPIIGAETWIEKNGVYQPDIMWSATYHKNVYGTTLNGKLCGSGYGGKIYRASIPNYEWSGCGDGKNPINVPLTQYNALCHMKDKRLKYWVRPLYGKWGDGRYESDYETGWYGNKDIPFDGLCVKIKDK